VKVTVTVPAIGATFHSDRNFYSPQDGQIDYTRASRRVAEEAEEVRRRVDQVAARVSSGKLDQAQSRLSSAADLAVSPDPETAKKAMDQVLEAKRLLAQVRQDHLQAIRELELSRAADVFDRVIRPLARGAEVSSHENLVVSAKRALPKGDGDFEMYLAEMQDIARGVLWRQDWFLIDRFNDLAEAPYAFPDSAVFDELITRGREALRTDDMPGLRSVVGELLRERISIGAEDGLPDAANVMRG
jgi:molecular chaperone DnaK